ncbi:hypothetical protein NS330_10830 [Curtobacterium citreum]|nr:hypothetical protein NS330_10830 [Curtobacterium citreum]
MHGLDPGDVALTWSRSPPLVAEDEPTRADADELPAQSSLAVSTTATTARVRFPTDDDLESGHADDGGTAPMSAATHSTALWTPEPQTWAVKES